MYMPEKKQHLLLLEQVWATSCEDFSVGVRQLIRIDMSLQEVLGSRFRLKRQGFIVSRTHNTHIWAPYLENHHIHTNMSYT